MFLGQKEALEKKIDFLIQEFRGYFFAFIAIASGESSLIYAVVSGNKPVYVLFLAIIGSFIIMILLLKIKNIKQEIYEDLKKLEDIKCN